MKGPFAYIYTISYPAGNVRYVGKSCNPKKRFRRHIQEARKYTTSHKLAWLRSLLNSGLEPIFEIIDKVPIAQWEEAEKFYISKYKNLGFDLTNGTIGGDGNQDPSQEVRDKISNTLKEYFKENDVWNKGLEGVSCGWTKGKKRSKEFGLADSLRKREEYKTRSQWNKGKPMSDEQKEKVRQARIGISSKPKPFARYTLDGKKLDEWPTMRSAIAEFGLSRKTLHKCLLGKLPNDGQWMWKYLKTA